MSADFTAPPKPGFGAHGDSELPYGERSHCDENHHDCDADIPSRHVCFNILLHRHRKVSEPRWSTRRRYFLVCGNDEVAPSHPPSHRADAHRCMGGVEIRWQRQHAARNIDESDAEITIKDENTQEPPSSSV